MGVVQLFIFEGVYKCTVLWNQKNYARVILTLRTRLKKKLLRAQKTPLLF